MYQRIRDLFIILFFIPLWLPVSILIALLIKISLGSPIIFRQERIGARGRPFTLLKFRSMTFEREENGEFKSDQKRLTRMGRFLRSTSLDELPELINVWNGSMSLVGPRPLLPTYVNRYSPEQARRHEVRPGMTGWAQIKGRNTLSWDEKFKLDVWYVDNQSLWLDIKILAITAWKVLTREGISGKGEATMSEFMGSKESTTEETKEKQIKDE